MDYNILIENTPQNYDFFKDPKSAIESLYLYYIHGGSSGYNIKFILNSIKFIIFIWYIWAILAIYFKIMFYLLIIPISCTILCLIFSEGNYLNFKKVSDFWGERKDDVPFMSWHTYFNIAYSELKKFHDITPYEWLQMLNEKDDMITVYSKCNDIDVTLSFVFFFKMIFITKDIKEVEERKKRICILFFILMPFTAVFGILIYIFFFISRWRYQDGYISGKDWTTNALWKLREINEVKEDTYERLYRGLPCMLSYSNSYYPKKYTEVAQFFLFIFTMFTIPCVILFILDYIKYRILSDVERTVLTFVLSGVSLLFITIYSVFIPSPYHYFNPEKDMQKLKTKIYNIPIEWTSDQKTFEQIKLYFTSRLYIHIKEYMAIFKTPFIFWKMNCIEVLRNYDSRDLESSIKTYSKYYDI